MCAQALSAASSNIPAPGYQAQSQPVLTDGGGGRWMVVVVDGHELSKKNMFFENISKTTRYFFLTVSRPLRRGFRTSFVKISKKLKKIKF